MNYVNIIVGSVCCIAGAAAGYYYGKQKEVKAYEADIASMKEEYQKKIDEAKKAGRREAVTMLSDVSVIENEEKQVLKPNGDIDDEYVMVVKEDEALDHSLEDIVYFAKDNVWYNQDQDKTYTKTEVFDVPTDLFTYFGEDKADLIYLHNLRNNNYYALRFNPGSYVSNVLGYDDTEDSKPE